MLTPYESSRYWEAFQEKKIEAARAHFEGISLDSLTRYEKLATKKSKSCDGILERMKYSWTNPEHPMYKLWAAKRILKENEQKRGKTS